MISPRIAIFIPCYNATKTIGQTLESVQEAILHFGGPVPVYLHDDCSKDDSLVKARAAWKRDDMLTISQNLENLGERKTSNKAFEYFSGKYDWVFMIHADDLVKVDWLSVIVDKISEADQEKCFTIWSSYDSLDNGTGKLTPGDNKGGSVTRTPTANDVTNYLSRLYSSWHISGAAFNVRLYRQLNGFDPAMPQFGDTDFFVRGLMAGYHDIYISRTLTAYRIFPDSVSDVSSKTNRDIREIYMLINKFKSRLTRSDIGRMYGIVQRLGLRRSVKWLLKGQFRLSMQNAAVFMRSFYERITINLA